MVNRTEVGQRERIFAPAGAGKTRELEDLARRHREEDGLFLGDMTIVSFTRAAAHEIAGRIAGDEHLTADDTAYCRTIHSLCFRALGLDTEHVATGKKLKQFFADLGIPYDPGEQRSLDEYDPQPGQALLGNLLIAAIEWGRNRMLPLDELLRCYLPREELLPWWTPQGIGRFLREYTSWKQDLHLVDFTDMIEQAIARDICPPTKLLIVDEAQDMTSLQWALISRWSDEHELTYVAGDDDQAIFSWLGSTPEDFLSWPEAAQHVRHINYRCGENIVHFANRVIERNKRRVNKHISAMRPGGTVTVGGALPDLDPTVPTFVLGRAKYLLGPHIARLEEDGVPFVNRRGSGGLNQSTELRAFLAVRALARGQSISLESLNEIYAVVPSTAVHHEQREQGTVTTRPATGLLEHGAKKRLAERCRDTEARHRYVKLNDLLELGGTPLLVERLRQQPAAVLGGITDRKLRYWERIAERFGEPALGQTPKIQLGTIHSVKGLEAERVYLCPDISPAIEESMQLDRQHAEDERRVWYVACTRARDSLSILDPETPRFYPEILEG